MATHYSDPTRAIDGYSLPDVETFYLSATELNDIMRLNGYHVDAEGDIVDTDGTVRDDAPYAGGPGWYFWYCLPGCLPDSEADGPYPTQDAALAAMRRTCDYGDTSDHPSLFD